MELLFRPFTSLLLILSNSIIACHKMCVCVCVYQRERDKERKREKEGAPPFIIDPLQDCFRGCELWAPVVTVPAVHWTFHLATVNLQRGLHSADQWFQSPTQFLPAWQRTSLRGLVIFYFFTRFWNKAVGKENGSGLQTPSVSRCLRIEEKYSYSL